MSCPLHTALAQTLARARADGTTHPMLVRAVPSRPDAQAGADAGGDIGDDADAAVTHFLDAVRSCAPFLRRLMTRSPDRLARVLAASPDDQFKSLFPAPIEGEDVAGVKKRLREAKADLALAIALADLSTLWDVHAVVRCLTDFADACVTQALAVAWGEAPKTRGVVAGPDGWPDDPKGLVLIAMGKMGAGELNYSSDIDLVALYDPDAIALDPDSRLDAKAVAVKIIQQTVDILHQQTEHGYVFRTDLRLRPNPGATPVAVSLAAAEVYYEVYGQNWERAAYIKARTCAGDPTLGAAFIEMMRPFVWRRTLDYGAVADIHAIKNQIHAEKGNPELAARGGNIKLGPGGIRELEFFVQTQQLLLGGRNETLRAPQTLVALEALAAFDHVEGAVATRLGAAYVYFRDLEHRLQMREDAQTQVLPDDDEIIAAMATMMGFADSDAFLAHTDDHLAVVHEAYADLFQTPEPKTPVPGSLVFTGVEDDPRTLTTLGRIGFSDPSAVTARIRRWHQGGLRATRSGRARELLTDLVPRILTQLGQMQDPDTAFMALDGFLVELPGGFQVFSLFTANPQILDDVLLLCQSSPALAKKMGRRPSLVEGLLEGVDVTAPDLPAPMEGDVLEDRLDTVRREVNEHRTRCAAALVLGRSDPITVGRALSDAADRAVQDLVAAVLKDVLDPGAAAPGELAVLGFGRLGMGALTAQSDLDLVFVYRAKADGGDQFFTRLIRRIVSALSVPTSEGELYEIDMKLRPSGGAGPAAVALSAFQHYYRHTAWVWEEMALTKVRTITGSSKLVAALEAEITGTLEKQRDADAVFGAVREMRARLLREKPARSPFDVKRMRGGLTDIDFLAQGMALVHAHGAGRYPPGTPATLAAMAAGGILPAAPAARLAHIYSAYECLVQYTRAAFGEIPPATIDAPRARRLRQLSADWDDRPIEVQLEDYSQEVEALFATYMEAGD